jgi:hypothetical protein
MSHLHQRSGHLKSDPCETVMIRRATEGLRLTADRLEVVDLFPADMVDEGERLESGNATGPPVVVTLLGHLMLQNWAQRVQQLATQILPQNFLGPLLLRLSFPGFDVFLTPS